MDTDKLTDKSIHNVDDSTDNDDDIEINFNNRNKNCAVMNGTNNKNNGRSSNNNSNSSRNLLSKNTFKSSSNDNNKPLMIDVNEDSSNDIPMSEFKYSIINSIKRDMKRLSSDHPKIYGGLTIILIFVIPLAILSVVLILKLNNSEKLNKSHNLYNNSNNRDVISADSEWDSFSAISNIAAVASDHKECSLIGTIDIIFSVNK